MPDKKIEFCDKCDSPAIYILGVDPVCGNHLRGAITDALESSETVAITVSMVNRKRCLKDSTCPYWCWGCMAANCVRD